jgi:hypothetical protein
VKLRLRKNRFGLLEPFGDDDAETIKKFPQGEMLNCEVKRIRNERFFKKWWVLVKYAYDMWEPDNKNIFNPVKNFEQFRKDIIVLAGFRNVVYSLNGDGFMLQPKSISWAEMDEQEFEELYNTTVNVIIQHVLTNYTGEDVDRTVDNIIMGFG